MLFSHQYIALFFPVLLFIVVDNASGETVVARSRSFLFDEPSMEIEAEAPTVPTVDFGIVSTRVLLNGSGIRIQLSRSLRAADIRVFSARGRLIGRGEFNGAAALIRLTGNQAIRGWYGIQIESGGKTFRRAIALLP